ncbi:MAG: FAD-dependent oxidoreductase [Aeromicrobium erythreum]
MDTTDSPSSPLDVLVVGGGAAGLSAALVLARSRRSVVVVDAGEPRNAPAEGVHNYLGREGTPPLELQAIGRDEVARYGGTVVHDRVVAITPVGDDEPLFDAELAGGRVLRARRVVLATGLVDELPDVPGLAERWGHEVLHCPYCHGWEVRDRRVGVLLTGPAGVHHAGLFRQLTDDVTLIAHDGTVDHDARIGLAARGVRVVEQRVARVLVEDDRLTGVELTGGERLDLDALVVAPFFRGTSALATSLGVPEAPIEMAGTVLGVGLEVDARGATPVPGVWAAGNTAAPMATVVASAAAGTQAGAALNADLVEEDTRAAVAAWRTRFREVDAWEERYGSDDDVWSGRVNPQLPVQVSRLAPGTALDVGCGEGGDVLWLAQQGWRVTGLDFSPAGLARAARHAEEAGVGDRTDWITADARTWEPGDRRWDLVTTHYLHLERDAMVAAVPRLASAVAPGGTLLVVLHHAEDMGAHAGHEDHLTPRGPRRRAGRLLGRPRRRRRAHGHGARS